jgi:putative transposase
MTDIQRAGFIEAMEAQGSGRRKRLKDYGISPSTYYAWKKRYDAGGITALNRHPRSGRRIWNRLTEAEEAKVLRVALDHPELSPRLVALHLTDNEGLSVSEPTVFRLLKSKGLIRPRPYDEMPAAKEWHHRTTRPDEIWQCDATQFVIPSWGRYKAIPVIDDYSRKILALPLKKDETSHSISDAIEEALENARKEGHTVDAMPTLLTDNGPGFVGEVLWDYLRAHGMKHIFGAPYHPQTQGKVERLNRKIKEKMCLVVSCSPDELRAQLAKFTAEYNVTPHGAIKNVSPNDMYAGRQEEILNRRIELKRLAIQNRKMKNLGGAA